MAEASAILIAGSNGVKRAAVVAARRDPCLWPSLCWTCLIGSTSRRIAVFVSVAAR
jgi:hypothetical protein